MNILILGYGKSGTTFLYKAMCDSFKETNSYFEPDASFIDGIDYSKSNIVKTIYPWKANIGNIDNLSNNFDKIIIPIRDPKDLIISATLWNAKKRHGVSQDDFNEFLLFLKQKHKNSKINLLSNKLFNETFKSILKVYNEDFIKIKNKKYKNLEFFKYSEFLKSLDGLSNFMNHKIIYAGDNHITNYVSRTKGSGYYKKWMTNSDVIKINNSFDNFYKTFLYTKQGNIKKESNFNLKDVIKFISNEN